MAHENHKARHARHHAEKRAMHTRHEKEHRDMADRHERELGGELGADESNMAAEGTEPTGGV